MLKLTSAHTTYTNCGQMKMQLTCVYVFVEIKKISPL